MSSTTFSTHRVPCAGQRGLTLIELMVAMVLGLLVLLAVIQILVSTRDSHRFQSNLARMQENGRFVVEKMTQAIRMNGFQGEGGNAWLLGPLAASNGGLTPLAGSNDDTNGSDTLRVAFQGTGDAFVKNCHGQPVPAGNVVLNRFAVNANDELECALSTDGGATWQTLTLVEGVEALHILYGVDTDADGSANQYVAFPNVANMERVVSVRIALLLVSQDDALVAEVDTTNYGLLDAQVHAGALLPGDRRARKLVLSTIQLRNHL